MESTFSAVKRKFGDAARAKTGVAMVNEILAKILAHNVCCCITAWYELGIAPAFDQGEPGRPRNVLPMPRRS